MPITTYGHVPSLGPLSDFPLLMHLAPIWNRERTREKTGEKDIKEMTTAGETRGEWWEDFNEQGNMLCNERKCKRKQKREETHRKDMREANQIRGSHDLLNKSRVHPICHIYFLTFVCG